MFLTDTMFLTDVLVGDDNDISAVQQLGTCHDFQWDKW